mgnify:CR=1 FL=1
MGAEEGASEWRKAGVSWTGSKEFKRMGWEAPFFRIIRYQTAPADFDGSSNRIPRLMFGKEMREGLMGSALDRE